MLQASHEFQGTSYNLLTKNCNHFTSYLCERLTGRPAPSYLNRAASIGVALPCVVPREWIAPPDYDTADGELLDEEFEDEGASMLRHDRERERHRTTEEARGWENAGYPAGSSRGDQGSARGPIRYEAGNLAPRLVNIAETDSSGRTIPPAERAPLPKNLT